MDDDGCFWLCVQLMMMMMITPDVDWVDDDDDDDGVLNGWMDG